ncbi:transcriptional regulator [Acidobacteria bacterium Mor1]|nr:transcriptional regulator [Acidobacteria bacterium Mor1]
MIRVILVEDQSMVLGALAALLNLEEDIEVLGTAASAGEALERIGEQKPDVVITDIEMPGMDGIGLAEQVRNRFEARVLILTTFARPGYLRRAMAAGAAGYLLKDSPAGELADAVRAVARGQRVIAPGLAQEAWASEDPLTERERQVLRLAREGRSSAEIAGELRLSDGTVRNYLSEAISKLGAKNRIEAARIAKDKGWI